MFVLSLRQYFSATDRIGLDPRYAELLIENHDAILASYQESIDRNAAFEFFRSSLAADLKRFEQWAAPRLKRRIAQDIKRSREASHARGDSSPVWAFWRRRGD